jgi:hypothetical protein
VDRETIDGEEVYGLAGRPMPQRAEETAMATAGGTRAAASGTPEEVKNPPLNTSPNVLS